MASQSMRTTASWASTSSKSSKSYLSSAASEGDTELPTVLRKLGKWAGKQAFGEPVLPTLFLPMKTPLTQELLDQHFEAEQPCPNPNTVAHLLAHCKAHGYQLGMIMNLAAHACLYAHDVPDDLPVQQVPLAAKVLPPEDAVQQAIAIADAFWAEHPEQYIAIHCDYGCNRTGFIVCAYLIQRCGFTPEAALETFAIARSGGINHESFQAELCARYAAYALPAAAVASLPPVTTQLPPAAHALARPVAICSVCLSARAHERMQDSSEPSSSMNTSGATAHCSGQCQACGAPLAADRIRGFLDQTAAEADLRVDVYGGRCQSVAECEDHENLDDFAMAMSDTMSPALSSLSAARVAL